MKVGITGHQDLGPKETIAWLTDALETVVHQYPIDMGITSLAIGADQLYAEILRKNEKKYIVVIPSEGYEKTFTNPNDLEKYKKLLRGVSKKLRLPFEKPSETAFYEAGKQLVNLSDMVIAIWDGQPAKGLGGTGDIVEYALSIKKPVVHLNPITQTVRKLSQQDKQTVMTYADLIIQWFERSNSESDIFTKFIFLYISFIAFLTQVNSGKKDRGIIESLKHAKDARSYYTALIQTNSELRATLQNLVLELRKQPISNDTRPNDTHWKGIDGVMQDETDWENLVEYWYRVRNNLFHGRKAPGFERDRNLVTYAYWTLTPLMENFIKHNLFWEFD